MLSYEGLVKISDAIFGKIKVFDIRLTLTSTEISSGIKSKLSEIVVQLPCCFGMNLLWFFMLVPMDNTNNTQ
jgi:hypothetical protein